MRRSSWTSGLGTALTELLFDCNRTWDFAGSETSSLLAQQVGNVWAGTEIVSLSFSGVLSVLDVRMPQPSRKLYGREFSHFPPSLIGVSSCYSLIREPQRPIGRDGTRVLHLDRRRPQRRLDGPRASLLSFRRLLPHQWLRSLEPRREHHPLRSFLLSLDLVRRLAQGALPNRVPPILLLNRRDP